MTASELAGVGEALERPVPATGNQRVVNTFNFTTYDPRAGVGALLCLNTIPGHPWLWRHGLMIFHPSGDVLWSKGYGRSSDPEVPGSGNLSFHCEQPFRRWTLRYDGFAQRTPPRPLRDRLLWNDLDSPLALELTWQALTPPWGHGSGDAVARTHYEQNGLVRGWVRFEGQTWELDTVGFRDRLLGPKDTSAMAGHNWIHGTWRDGRAFALTDVRLKNPDTPRVANACVHLDGAQHEATVTALPTWDDTHPAPGPLDIHLTCAGRDVRITARPLRSAPWTYVTNPHVPLQSALFGHDPARSGALLLWESAAEFSWDGELGHGHVEQSLVNA
jgi:hypothetical protein